MQIAAFNARCPYEIGDKIRTRTLAPNQPRIGRLVIEEVHTITDIVCTHYLKSGVVEFLYELDGNGKLVYIAAPKEK